MRLAGAMLQETEIRSSGFNNLKQNIGVTDDDSDNPTLSDLGLTKNESSIG